jgi:hypothetical protein
MTARAATRCSRRSLGVAPASCADHARYADEAPGRFIEKTILSTVAVRPPEKRSAAQNIMTRVGARAAHDRVGRWNPRSPRAIHRQALQ